MELSKRLSAVAGLVTEGASVADIGTDHGYIPIYLAGRDRQTKLLAMDVNPGPLSRAAAHIREEGLGERIELRLSDGLSALKPGEVHTIIAAGMGGPLVIRILEAHPEVTASVREFVLQPQSGIRQVRAWLETHGFLIDREDMVEEQDERNRLIDMKAKGLAFRLTEGISYVLGLLFLVSGALAKDDAIVALGLGFILTVTIAMFAEVGAWFHYEKKL